MHIAPELLPSWLIVLCSGLMIVSVLIGLWRSPWRSVVEVPERMHLIAGGAVLTGLLWLMNIRLSGDVTLHLLGVTTLTLLLGWHLAILSGLAALALYYFANEAQWQAFPVSFTLTILVPATVTMLFARALYRPALQHPFIYMLGAGFLGGALVVLALALIWVILFYRLGQLTVIDEALVLWPLLPLIMFSEGFINGMCVSALAIFHPNWLKTFNEGFYFEQKK